MNEGTHRQERRVPHKDPSREIVIITEMGSDVGPSPRLGFTKVRDGYAVVTAEFMRDALDPLGVATKAIDGAFSRSPTGP